MHTPFLQRVLRIGIIKQQQNSQMQTQRVRLYGTMHTLRLINYVNSVCKFNIYIYITG